MFRTLPSRNFYKCKHSLCFKYNRVHLLLQCYVCIFFYIYSYSVVYYILCIFVYLFMIFFKQYDKLQSSLFTVLFIILMLSDVKTKHQYLDSSFSLQYDKNKIIIADSEYNICMLLMDLQDVQIEHCSIYFCKIIHKKQISFDLETDNLCYFFLTYRLRLLNSVHLRHSSQRVMKEFIIEFASEIFLNNHLNLKCNV